METARTPSRTPGAPPRLKPVTVEELVATDVVTVQPDDPVKDAIDEMQKNDVGSVVVVEDDSPVGIVTDRTIALSLLGTSDLPNTEVSELIDREPITTTTDDSVFDAIDKMQDNGIRRLPVVDEQETLEGIVSLDDILIGLTRELELATEIIEKQSPRF